MIDFSKLFIMLIKHQPLEAYFFFFFFACCTIVNMGACASTVLVEGPVSASPFFGEYGGIDLVSPSPYLVRAHNLIYSYMCHGLL